MVNPSVPARTLPELIALIKANPGKYSYATPGFGTTPHLAGERLFDLTYHLDITHVPYPGGAPAITSTMAGQTQILLITIGSVAPHLKDGSLRAIAIESTKRWPAFPDIPTLAESGLVGYDAEFILGFMAPAGTPKNTVDLLSGAITEALTSQERQRPLRCIGFAADRQRTDGVCRQAERDLSRLGQGGQRGRHQDRLIAANSVIEKMIAARASRSAAPREGIPVKHMVDPPPAHELEKLVGLIGGYRISQSIYVAVELGIPDLLAHGPRTTSELATATAAHAGNFKGFCGSWPAQVYSQKWLRISSS